MLKVLYGLAGSLIIAGLAYYRKSLTISGSFAAVIAGTLLFSLGSLPWYGVLIVFFVFSTLLSKFKQQVKANVQEHYEKSGTRDAGQVLANGGLGVLCCVMHAIFPHPLWFYAFLGAMAAVTADTWATEIGGLSRRSPISILTGRKVLPGTSGGVTLWGFLASLAGAAFIATTAVILYWISMELQASMDIRISHLLLTVTAGGFVGALVDSCIGAIWQRMYRCHLCGKVTERKEHCGRPCVHIRGPQWLNNDAVNFICSLAGALVTVLLNLSS